MSVFFMGIDVSAGACRGVLLDEDGRCLARHSVPHMTICLQPGLAEQDAERAWWNGLCSVSRALLEQSGADPARVAAVCCSADDPCCMPVDADGTPLCRALLPGDRRAAREAAELTRATGEDFAPEDLAARLFWLRRHQAAASGKAAYFVTAAAWLTGRLTGQYFIDRHTAAQCAPLYDKQTADWLQTDRPALCRPDQLPVCAWAGTPAGLLTEAAAAATGLCPGTPVAVGTHTQAAVAIGANAHRRRRTLLTIGETLTLRYTADTRLSDDGIAPIPGPFPELTTTHAVLPSPGPLLRWLSERFAPVEAEAMPPMPAFLPGSEGLVLLPYLSGAADPINDRRASGMMLGLRAHHTRAHLQQAALEAVGYSIAQQLFALSDAGAHIFHAVAVGPAAQDRAWMQMICDICAVQLELAGPTDPARGCAMLAAQSAGCTEAAEAAGRQALVETLFPDLEHHARYRPYVDAYIDLYDAAARLMHRDLSNYLYL